MLFYTAQLSIKKRACGRRKIKENKNEFNIIISYIYYLLFFVYERKNIKIFFIYCYYFYCYYFYIRHVNQQNNNNYILSK